MTSIPAIPEQIQCNWCGETYALNARRNDLPIGWSLGPSNESGPDYCRTCVERAIEAWWELQKAKEPK